MSFIFIRLLEFLGARLLRQLRRQQLETRKPLEIDADPQRRRVALLKEHAATIKEAMVQIKKLKSNIKSAAAPGDPLSLNQAARWVATKEKRADEIVAVVSEYMLCQCVKREAFQSEGEYLQALTFHHQLMQAAMQTKETVDEAAVDALERAIEQVAGGGRSDLAPAAVSGVKVCIFEDPVRVALLKEHAGTIKEAMLQIKKMKSNIKSAKTPGDPLSLNQAARWVSIKEKHVDDIIRIVSEYMLCQRAKREVFQSEGEYLQALLLHHQLMQAAAQSKETVDEAVADALDQAIDRVGKMYTK